MPIADRAGQKKESINCAAFADIAHQKSVSFRLRIVRFKYNYIYYQMIFENTLSLSNLFDISVSF